MVALPPARNVDVFVRTPTGKTLNYSVAPEETTEQVVNSLSKRTGCSRDSYLVSGTKPLRPCSPVLSADVCRGETLTLLERRRGGCFIFSIIIFCTIIFACMCSVFTFGFSLCVIPFLLPLLFILPCFCL